MGELTGVPPAARPTPAQLARYRALAASRGRWWVSDPAIDAAPMPHAETADVRAPRASDTSRRRIRGRDGGYPPGVGIPTPGADGALEGGGRIAQGELAHWRVDPDGGVALRVILADDRVAFRVHVWPEPAEGSAYARARVALSPRVPILRRHVQVVQDSLAALLGEGRAAGMCASFWPLAGDAALAPEVAWLLDRLEELLAEARRGPEDRLPDLRKAARWLLRVPRRGDIPPRGGPSPVPRDAVSPGLSSGAGGEGPGAVPPPGRPLLPALIGDPTPLAALALRKHVSGALRAEGIATVGESAHLGERRALGMRSLGPLAVWELRDALSARAESLRSGRDGRPLCPALAFDFAPLSALEPALGARTYMLLCRTQVRTVSDLAAYSEAELLSVRNMGKDSVARVRLALDARARAAPAPRRGPGP